MIIRSLFNNRRGKRSNKLSIKHIKELMEDKRNRNHNKRSINNNSRKRAIIINNNHMVTKSRMNIIMASNNKAVTNCSTHKVINMLIVKVNNSKKK